MLLAQEESSSYHKSHLILEPDKLESHKKVNYIEQDLRLLRKMYTCCRTKLSLLLSVLTAKFIGMIIYIEKPHVLMLSILSYFDIRAERTPGGRPSGHAQVP